MPSPQPSPMMRRSRPGQVGPLLLAHHLELGLLARGVGVQDLERVPHGLRLPAVDRKQHVAGLERRRRIRGRLQHQESLARPEVLAQILAHLDQSAGHRRRWRAGTSSSFRAQLAILGPSRSRSRGHHPDRHPTEGHGHPRAPSGRPRASRSWSAPPRRYSIRTVSPGWMPCASRISLRPHRRRSRSRG